MTTSSHPQPANAGLDVLERACDVVVYLDSSGDALSASADTFAALGMEPDELVGRPPHAWLLPVTASELLSLLGHGGGRMRAWRRRGRSWWACNLAVTPVGEPGEGRWVAAGLDDRGRSGSGADTDRFLDSVGIAILTVDTDGVVLDAFGAAAALLGASENAELVGARPLESAVPAPTASLDDGSQPGELGLLTQMRVRRGDGTLVWVDSRSRHDGDRTHLWLRESSDVLLSGAGPAEDDTHPLSLLFGGVGDYVSVYDTDRNEIWSSPSVRALLDQIGTHGALLDAALTHPDDRAAARHLWDDVVAGGIGARRAARLRVGHPDGPWQLFEVTVTNRVDDPALAGVVVHARDITDASVAAEIRRGTQQALMTVLRDRSPQQALEIACLSLEKMLYPHYPSAAVAFVHLDLDGGRYFARKVTGARIPARRPLGSALDMDVRQLLDLAQATADAATGGVPVRSHPLPCGEAAPFTHTWTLPLLGADHRPVGVLVVLLEDDDRHPDALALRALERFAPLASLIVTRHLQRERTDDSEARFRSVFHEAAVPSALVSTDGTFLEVNDALAQMVDRPAKDLAGTAVADLEVPNRTLSPQGAVVWRTGGGRELWVERTSADVHASTGQVRYRVEHYVDVTAQRTTEEEVRLLNELLCTRIAELDAAKDRLAAAFRKITSVREDERRALAVQLHDETVQQLIAASWMLDEVHPDSADPDVAAIGSALAEATDSVRAIIHDLRPPSLDVIGLAQTLESTAHRTLGDAVLVEVVDKLGHELSRDVALLVFRTVGEALCNIRKHSDADHVQIALGRVGDTVVVKVTDNGRGFNHDRALERAQEGHYGVTSMREQILLAGGRFHIGDRVDGQAGTEVSLALPQLPEDLTLSGWPT